MSLETIALLESVNKYNDASFVTFDLKNSSVIVENDKTKELFSFPVSFDENSIFTLSGKDAVKISSEDSEDTETNEPTSLVEACAEFLAQDTEEKNIFPLVEACWAMKAKKKGKKKDEMVKVESIFSEPVNIAYENYKVIITAFIEECNLFDENNKPVNKEIIYTPDFLLEAKEWKESIREAVLESADSYSEFLKESDELLKDHGIENSKAIFEGLDIIGGNKFYGITTQKLVRAKKETDLDFKVESVVAKLEELRNKHFSETFQESFRATLDAPDRFGHLSSPASLKYLKFHTGVFDRDAVGRLLEDFNMILSKYLEMDTEEMNYVCKMKDVVDFMYRTEKIDDELLFRIIREFNDRFGTKTVQPTQSEAT